MQQPRMRIRASHCVWPPFKGGHSYGPLWDSGHGCPREMTLNVRRQPDMGARRCVESWFNLNQLFDTVRRPNVHRLVRHHRHRLLGLSLRQTRRQPYVRHTRRISRRRGRARGQRRGLESSVGVVAKASVPLPQVPTCATTWRPTRARNAIRRTPVRCHSHGQL